MAADERQAYAQDRLDAENGVVVTEIGRYVPPTDAVRAAAVLVRQDRKKAKKRKNKRWEKKNLKGSIWCGVVAV